MDLISREAVIDDIKAMYEWHDVVTEDRLIEHMKMMPATQPTLYGYKIEHLAYIARVMEKEGVTADYAVRTFDDISRALRMIIEETQQKVMETLNERYDLQTGGD